jgi:predicted ATPase/DNA-binding CsgD family transcriptional regulator
MRGAPLVGREAEIAGILAAFEAAAAGSPAAVLVTGEPGAGKSRLLQEARSWLGVEDRALVLCGYALEGVEAAPPYFPLSRAFAAVLQSGSVTLPQGSMAVLVAAGVAGAPVARRRPARLEPTAERLRTFDALGEVCARLAADRPLLIALDDMQWAAPVVWQALAYLTRSLDGVRLCLLLAVREEVLHALSSAAAQAIAELSRQRLLTRIAAGPLPAAGVGRLAGALLGGPPASGLVELLVSRTEGNPLFVEEVLGDLDDRGALTQTTAGWDVWPDREEGTPVTLRMALAARLERLPAATQGLLAAASVLGRSFRPAVLAAMLQVEPDEVEASLRPAVAACLVDPVADGGWTFRHDMIRETADELWPSERARLHAAAAGALASEGGGTSDRSRLGAVARHWLLAGEPGRAAEVARAAAEAAAASHAYDEALGFARLARTARETAAAAGEPTTELADARLGHGEAALAAGEYGDAEEALRAGLAAAEALSDVSLQAVLRARLGALYRRRELAEDAAGCLHAALDLVEGQHGQARLEAEVLVELAALNGLTRGRYVEAEAQASRALELASSCAEPGLEAQAALALANGRARSADPVEVRPLLERALERALAADDLSLAAEVCASLSNSHYWTGSLRASSRYGSRRLLLAERGADVFSLRHGRSWMALLAFSRGDWDEARQLLAAAEPALLRFGSPEPLAFLRVVQGLIAYRVGPIDEARGRLAEMLELLGRAEPATLVWYAGLHALVCIESGAADEAERTLAAQEERLANLSVEALPARSARTVQGLAYAALGDQRRGASCESALRPYADDFHWWPARRTLAALAAMRGDRPAAVAHLDRLETQCRREGLRPDLALGAPHRAELRGASGAADRAEALRLLEQLGMHRDLERAKQMARRLPARFGALTPRELEVLRLVARGMTNREIAAALFISERTVVNHVSHVFSKVGVDNRSGATAYALHNGIA